MEIKAWRNSAPATVSHSDKQSITPSPTQKDVKNEGRSGKVYENKGSIDKMPEKKSDIYARSSAISQKNSDFERQFAGNCAFETHFVRLRTAQVRASVAPRHPKLPRRSSPAPPSTVLPPTAFMNHL